MIPTRRDWRHWALAVPIGVVFVFLLPMVFGWVL